jgi:tetratricopeptide (TPR) repeat protein
MAAAGATELEPIPKHGLSLAALRAFCAKHAGETVLCEDASGAAGTLPFEALTTTQVVLNVIKPATLVPDGEPVTYAELHGGATDDRGRPLVAPATRFVSHAWAYQFADLLSALATLPDADEQYFWIDIFVGAQHKAPTLPQEWWSTTFKDAVAHIGHTVLVLQPWHAPVPLTRSWCLWEIFCTLDTAKELTIVLSQAQQEAFQKALLDEFDSIVMAMSKIDTRKAEAFKEADEKMIYAAIEKTAGGFTEVNGRIHDRLREWLAQAARELLVKLRRGKGDTHKETLQSMNRLAMLLFDQGKLDEAEPLFRETLRVRRETLGDTHPDTLGSINNLALLLRDQGKLVEAEPLYRETLRGSRETLGDTHLDTLGSINNMAILLMNQGKLIEAEPLYREALRGKRETLGHKHPKTLDSINNLAILLRKQGKLDEAVPLFREALRGRRETLGDTHPSTMASINNLDMLLSNRGKLEAKALSGESNRCRCCSVQ